jgi:plasmid maintenance system antidote protein VapI
MLIAERRPLSVDGMLTEEFLILMGLTQGALAEAMACSVSW